VLRETSYFYHFTLCALKLYFTAADSVLIGGNASFEFMQPNMSTWLCLTPSATSGCNPLGLALDRYGNLYVSDNYHDRVVVYAGGQPTSNGMAAIAVIGQSNLTSGDSNLVPTSPQGIAFDISTNALWVANGLFVTRYPNIAVLYSQNLSSLEVVLGFQGISPGVHIFPKGNFEGMFKLKQTHMSDRANNCK